MNRKEYRMLVKHVSAVRSRTARRSPRVHWAELIGTYGLWALALILGALGVIGLGQ